MKFQREDSIADSSIWHLGRDWRDLELDLGERTVAE